MTKPLTERREWVVATVAAAALGVATSTLKKNAASMGVRVRTVPGRRGRLFNLPDVELALRRMVEAESAQIAARQTPGPSQGERGNGTARTKAG